MTHLGTWLLLADRGEELLAGHLRAVADEHARVADVHHLGRRLAGIAQDRRERVATFLERYPAAAIEEGWHPPSYADPRPGEIGLLWDLQDLRSRADLVHTTWRVIAQCAQAVRDEDLLEVALSCDDGVAQVRRWLLTQIDTAAPQAVVSDG